MTLQFNGSKKITCPQRLRFPVVVVVRKAIHFLVLCDTSFLLLFPAFFSHPLRLFHLTSFLSSQSTPETFQLQFLTFGSPSVANPLAPGLFSLPSAITPTGLGLPGQLLLVFIRFRLLQMLSNFLIKKETFFCELTLFPVFF